VCRCSYSLCMPIVDLERRVHSQQLDLNKIHRQWFTQELEKREKILKHETNMIRRIQRDYDKLEELSTERIQLAENALLLVRPRKRAWRFRVIVSKDQSMYLL
jgi:hypothetical protein